MAGSMESFELATAYTQFYIYWDVEFWNSLQNWNRMFDGQQEVENVGAADGNGVIFLTLQDDRILVQVESLPEPPSAVDLNEWSEVSEVSFSIPSGVDVALATWAEGKTYPLAIGAGEYRLRFSRRLEPNPEFNEEDGDDELYVEPLIEMDRVELWRAERQPDQLVR